MNKTDFLAQLYQKLRERGVQDEMVNRQVAKFERYLADSDIESPELESDFSDIDSIADEISILLKTRGNASAAHGANQNEYADSAEPVITYSADGQEGAAPNTMSFNKNTVNKATPDAVPNGQEDAAADDDFADDDAPGLLTAIKELFSSAKKAEKTPQELAGDRLFWSLFLLSLPITLALCLAVLALFAGAYISLAAMIVALIGGLITVAAGGTALSLIGIIYGATQIVHYVPIGMYEIGLGVAIGGAAMFGGIAMYNIALRLIPYAAKKLTVFLKFTLKQAKRLFILAKGACVKI